MLIVFLKIGRVIKARNQLQSGNFRNFWKLLMRLAIYYEIADVPPF
jgi:hypothetical protein